MVDVLPARTPGLAVAAFDPDIVVHDPRTDEVHLVEGLAAVVLGACDGATRRAAVVADVAEALGIDPAAAERTVATALADLAAHGLVTPAD